MSRQRRERWLKRLLALAAAASGLILLPIVVMLVYESLPLLAPAPLWQSLSSVDWQPQAGDYGLLAMLVGSLLVSLLALALAAPLGILFAVWLNLYLPRSAGHWLRPLQELLAGIPSVVYGLWGLLVLVPIINSVAPPGASLLTAALVLALMILPYSGLVTDAALQAPLQRQMPAARALALSRWGTFCRVLWPQTRVAILGGIVLQFGRALGETLAVVMVVGNVVQLPASLFDPVRTLTGNIALEMGYATAEHQSALFFSGLLLLMLTLVLMLAVRRRGTLA